MFIICSVTPSASCFSARVPAVSVPPLRLRLWELKRSTSMMTPSLMAARTRRCQALSRPDLDSGLRGYGVWEDDPDVVALADYLQAQAQQR